MAVPQIQLNEENLSILGEEYAREIVSLESSRQELLDDYTIFVENYEGDVQPPESEKPWVGSSDAHLPATAEKTDITYSRFMNAVFGQFPKFMISALSGKWSEFARKTQLFSEWLETSEIPLRKVFQKLFLITVKFGTGVVYIPWENQPIKNMRLNENDVFVPAPGDKLDKPNLRVIHPKDFLLPFHSTDLQEAPWCGYRYKLRRPTLMLWKDRKFFRSKAARKLLEMLAAPSPRLRAAAQQSGGGDGRFDRIQETRETVVGLRKTSNPNELDMVHIFARLDIDGDGLEEEVNLHMHEKTGIIARISFNHYRHAKRPFVDFHFFPRDGIWYSIGIPEMTRDLQKNMDVTFRQIQDNNTVKNTQSFKATEGGTIKPDEPFHPAKIYFVRPGFDFEPLRLGDTSINTQIQDLNILDTWLERRTGVQDPALPGDRTPATSFLASLQENARRIDLVIGDIRESLSEVWNQVLELYAQFKPVVEFEVKRGEKFEMIEWNSLGDEEFRKRVAVKATASSSALNKAVARQEWMAFLQTLTASNETTVQLLDLFLRAQDPSLKTFILKSMEGQHKVTQRIFDTFGDAKDQDELLPNPEEFLPNVNPLQPPVGDEQGPPAPGSPQGLSPGASAGVAPATAPNRPGRAGGVPGQPTLPGRSSNPSEGS
jgi:hypothetical protein